MRKEAEDRRKEEEDRLSRLEEERREAEDRLAEKLAVEIEQDERDMEALRERTLSRSTTALEAAGDQTHNTTGLSSILGRYTEEEEEGDGVEKSDINNTE